MTSSSDRLACAVAVEANRRLTRAFQKIEHCLDQLTDEQVWWRPQETQNSIANLMLHLCGNLRQWIISGIGGAADVRQRPAEFSERRMIPRTQLLEDLNQTLGECRSVLTATTSESLLQDRRIQGFDVKVIEALFDTVTHFVGHAHQIVYITRLQLGDAYTFEWTPTEREQGAEL